MLPFYSIFNEWYAAQTSKKIRAVNDLKASQGRRLPLLSPTDTRRSKATKSSDILTSLRRKSSEGYSPSALSGKVRRRSHDSWNRKKF